MCSTYDFKPVKGGKFAVFIRHPGGNELIAIVDDPSVFPRRAKDAPDPQKTLMEAPAMYPDYFGPVVRMRDGNPELTAMSWGFIPHWSDRPIQNARSDKLDSAAWKKSFQTRRCVAPATSFCEWQSVPGVKKKLKLKIRPTDQDEVFLFAGFWQEFKGPQAKPVECYTIVTTEPNDFMKPIHNRMPLILTPEQHERWLDPSNTTGAGLEDILKPYAGPMEAKPADQGPVQTTML